MGFWAESPMVNLIRKNLNYNFFFAWFSFFLRALDCKHVFDLWFNHKNAKD